LVPQAAIVTRDGGPKVFEVVEGKAVLRTISVGLTRNDQVVVTDGLAGSELLVSKPPDTLRDGDRITVRKKLKCQVGSDKCQVGSDKYHPELQVTSRKSSPASCHLPVASCQQRRT